MAESPKSSKESSKNEAHRRSSSDTRDENVSKQQKKVDYAYQKLPGMKLAASKPSSGSGKDPIVEISHKEKSLQATHMLDHNSPLPDLNVTAPEVESINDAEKEFQKRPSLVDNDLQEVVKVVRKLEIEGHISGNFRVKFLTWYGLHCTAKEHDVVLTFIRTLDDDPSCLAGQLIDSFSNIITRRS